jgi:adenine phosphoribosyltransferase
MIIDQIRNKIKTIENFPKSGISFKDISPLLASDLFLETIKLLGSQVEKPDYWVGIESRGFILASALSIHFGGGVIMCRKKGKLPPPVHSLNYSLEYGEDTLEIQPGKGNVIIVDDVLATGGTMLVAEKLVLSSGYNLIDKLVLINLSNLNKLENVKFLLKYE